MRSIVEKYFPICFVAAIVNYLSCLLTATFCLTWRPMFVSSLAAAAFEASIVPTDLASRFPSTYFVLSLEERFKAVTDAGRDIPLFNYELILVPEAPEQNFNPQQYQREFLLTLEQQYLASINRDVRKLVRVAEPLPSSNCHGWVFTGGRFGIQDAHVATIL